jgi:hypothetical protein
MQKYKLLYIYNIYFLRMCVEMHPFIHPAKQLNRPQHNHHYFFTSDIHQYPTSSSTKNLLYIPNPHNYSKTYQPAHHLEESTKKHSHLWNQLPPELRLEKNVERFKKQLKLHLLQLQEKQILT